MIPLAQVPQDLLSKVAFSPRRDERILLGAFWDSTLKLYDCNKGQLDGDGRPGIVETFNLTAPLLDACWSTDSTGVIFTAGLERRVNRIDLNVEKRIYVGNDHADAIKSVVYDSTTHSVLSGSWDGTIQQSDVRSSESMNSIKVPGKVLTMDLVDHLLVAGMTGREIYVFDTRKLNEPVQVRESSLRDMLRTIRCMPNGKGYSCTSLGGRVAVEYFDPSPEAQMQKFAFKCHKIGEAMGPVNGLVFHPKKSMLFTGGSDSTVCIWDIEQKKRVKQFKSYAHSIMSLDISPDGELLAVGCSSDQFKETPQDFNKCDAIQSSIYMQTLSS